MLPGESGDLGVHYDGDEVISNDAIADRCVELSQIFDKIKEVYGKKLAGTEMFLDESRLILAITAYFNDITRHKSWRHRNLTKLSQARINASTKAAFTCYWLNKIGPIYFARTALAVQGVDPDSGLPIDVSLMINTHYALFVAMIYLNFKITPKVLRLLIHRFHWRDPSPQMILVMFELLSMVSRGEPIVINELL